MLHAEREELHGITVIVDAAAGTTWVGRYHERTERGLLLLDVAIHEPGKSPITREAWLDHLRKFGVKADAKHVVVPHEQQPRIRRLMD